MQTGNKQAWKLPNFVFAVNISKQQPTVTCPPLFSRSGVCIPADHFACIAGFFPLLALQLSYTQLQSLMESFTEKTFPTRATPNSSVL